MPLEWGSFFVSGEVSSLPLFYDWRLVALSLLIAVLCSVASLQVLSIASKEARARVREVLLITGACALGFGVWAMHFIGMLSLNLCTPVSYVPSWTAASMVPSLLASYVALKRIAGMQQAGPSRLLAAGAASGAGIGLMHYSGMAAMQMQPLLRYDPFYFGVSIGVALVLSTFAIWIRFGLASRSQRLSNVQLNALSGTVMGLAIAGTHYTGMLAARFIGEPVAGAASRVDFPIGLGLALFAVVAVFAVLVLGSNSLWHYRRLVGRLELESQRLATILHSMRAAMITTDRQGLILEFNHEAQKIFGWAPAEVLGQAIAPLLLLPQDMPVADMRPGATAREIVALRKGGGRFQASLLWGQAQVNDQTLFIACLADLTQEKQQHTRLERAHSIIEASQDAIISKTLEGVITSWNKGAQQMFGHTAAQALGQSMLRLIPEDRKGEEQSFLRQMALGQRMDSFETVRLTKAGAPIHVSVTISPMRGPFGDIVGVSTIARDIGDRKAAELLRQERERAHFADAARTELMVGLNHEIRTPLSQIEGFAHVLLDSPLQAEQVLSVQAIQQSSRQLQADLNNILESVEISSGRAQVQRLRFNPAALMEQVRQAFLEQASARQVEWTTQCQPPSPPDCWGDLPKIRQILDRLVANAFKFTAAGQVSLTLTCSATQLEVAITDTGCGMDGAQLATLFKPLRQADTRMARQHGGMGMGCALSLQLAELMGGSIAVHSSVGHGSCLTLRLPLEARAVADVAAAGADKQIPPAPPRLSILAVDDTPLNLKLISALVKNQHQLTTALSAQEALAALRDSAFDLILMDVQMPGMDGLEATREIRRQEAERGSAPVCIMALTANVSDHDRRNALEAGMNGFLAKPLTRQRLNECVAQLRP